VQFQHLKAFMKAYSNPNSTLFNCWQTVSRMITQLPPEGASETQMLNLNLRNQDLKIVITKKGL